jgi:hypothetical protein
MFQEGHECRPGGGGSERQRLACRRLLALLGIHGFDLGLQGADDRPMRPERIVPPRREEVQDGEVDA